jgi:23S rRNA pseudouridine2605 synthase
MIPTLRLQRFLAQAGIAARRKAEILITDGRVKVNGRVVTELGTKVDPAKDKVEVDGKRVAAEEPMYLLLNKPKGYVTTASDPQNRPTVMTLVPRDAGRVFPVGRLDFNTEGVLLLTNDGELANQLAHPSGGVEKTYHVKVRGSVDDRSLAALAEGIRLDDGDTTAPAQVLILGASQSGNNTWLEVTLHEGKNRQIHRMFEALGYQVAKLKRISYGGLTTDGVRPGKVRQLRAEEVRKLRKSVHK